MRTVSINQAKHKAFLRRLYASRRVVFYALLFLSGVLLGAIFLRGAGSETMSKLAVLVGHFAQRRGEQTVLATFISSFTSTAAMLAALLVCGFCAVAQPVIVLLPFFRGLGYGYQAGYIYAQNGITGIGYTTLVLLPNMLLSTLIIVYACGEAFVMSTSYYRSASHLEGSKPINVSSYLVKFFFMFVLAFFVSVLDAVCTGLFSGLFVLA